MEGRDVVQRRPHRPSLPLPAPPSLSVFSDRFRPLLLFFSSPSLAGVSAFSSEDVGRCMAIAHPPHGAAAAAAPPHLARLPIFVVSLLPLPVLLVCVCVCVLYASLLPCSSQSPLPSPPSAPVLLRGGPVKFSAIFHCTCAHTVHRNLRRCVAVRCATQKNQQQHTHTQVGGSGQFVWSRSAVTTNSNS